ncbi:hemerythrin domain-containing protein [Micromonospora sp. NPDC047738]|uniref:hemerythrin domain-containing protein n=1 Tax=unclassified Micromonospora TaxID=2617518 RepID=UPI0034071582
MPSDAIDLLIEDHREIRKLFKDFQDTGADANRKKQLVSQILEALTMHTYIENECMYPETRRLTDLIIDDQ